MRIRSAANMRIWSPPSSIVDVTPDNFKKKPTGYLIMNLVKEFAWRMNSELGIKPGNREYKKISWIRLNLVIYSKAF